MHTQDQNIRVRGKEAEVEGIEIRKLSCYHHLRFAARQATPILPVMIAISPVIFIVFSAP